MAIPVRKLDEFQSVEFWDNFFQTLNAKSFEWYCDYEALKPFVLHRCKERSVLIPGCGNSDLSAKLYDDGAVELMNIDFSKLVIREMLTKNLRQRPEMKWQVMDVTKMKFPDSSFEVVLDKGTLDALMSDADIQSKELGRLYLREVVRVMKPSSVYFCVSLLQSHILERLVRFFRDGFQSSIHELVLTDKKQVSEIRTFLFVAERSENGTAASEVELHMISPPAQDESLQIKDIKNIVASENDARREQAQPRSTLRHGHDFDQLHPGRRLVLESLQCPYSVHLKRKLRFMAVILDNAESFEGVCSVFIVPRRQSQDWIYASEEGQWTVSRRCQARRVILVVLQDHKESYTMEQIQEALSPGVIPYIPRSVRSVKKATPFLTSKATSDISCDRAVYESALNGNLIVRDVLKDRQILRRLYFSVNDDLIQSEIRLLSSTEITGEEEELPDVECLRHDEDFLSAHYQKIIVSGLRSLQQQRSQEDTGALSVMIIGLGGGVLPVYLDRHFHCTLSVVELDPVTLKAAKDWFGLSDSIPVSIADGVHFIHTHANQGTTMDVLIIDAGGAKSSCGMSCPPPSFLSAEFLEATKQCLNTGGTLVINFVSRSEEAYRQALESLQSVYPYVSCFCVKEDTNRVAFAAEQEFQFTYDLQVKCEDDWKMSDIIKGLDDVTIRIGNKPVHHHRL